MIRIRVFESIALHNSHLSRILTLEFSGRYQPLGWLGVRRQRLRSAVIARLGNGCLLDFNIRVILRKHDGVELAVNISGRGQ